MVYDIYSLNSTRFHLSSHPFELPKRKKKMYCNFKVPSQKHSHVRVRERERRGRQKASMGFLGLVVPPETPLRLVIRGVNHSYTDTHRETESENSKKKV